MKPPFCSIEIIRWATGLAISNSQKAVLVALINFADLKTGQCFPSIKQIMERSSRSERSVQRALKALHDIKLIHRKMTLGCSTLYTVNFGKTLEISVSDPRHSGTPVTVAPPSQCHPHPRHSDTPTPVTVTPKQSILTIQSNNPSINTPLSSPRAGTDHGSKTEKAKPLDLFTDPIAEQPSCQPKATPSRPKLERIPEQDFDEFWTAYPRKEGKGAARRAFEKARRKISQRLLIRCVLAWPFAEKLSDRGDFRPHPATWLNNERWLDESVRHVLKVTDETPEQREAIAAFNRARDAYIAKISMGVTQSGMKMPVLEDFLAKHAQSTRRDNIAVH